MTAIFVVSHSTYNPKRQVFSIDRRVALIHFPNSVLRNAFVFFLHLGTILGISIWTKPYLQGRVKRAHVMKRLLKFCFYFSDIDVVQRTFKKAKPWKIYPSLQTSWTKVTSLKTSNTPTSPTGKTSSSLVWSGTSLLWSQNRLPCKPSIKTSSRMKNWCIFYRTCRIGERIVLKVSWG